MSFHVGLIFIAVIITTGACYYSNDCGSNSVGGLCDNYGSNDHNDSDIFAKVFGGFFGAIAGLIFLVCATAIIIVIIIVVVCVQNKNCPFYKERHRQQHPTRVGVLAVVQDSISEPSYNESFNAGNTSKGLDEGVTKEFNHGESNWFSTNAYLN